MARHYTQAGADAPFGFSQHFISPPSFRPPVGLAFGRFDSTLRKERGHVGGESSIRYDNLRLPTLEREPNPHSSNSWFGDSGETPLPISQTATVFM